MKERKKTIQLYLISSVYFRRCPVVLLCFFTSALFLSLFRPCLTEMTDYRKFFLLARFCADQFTARILLYSINIQLQYFNFLSTSCQHLLLTFLVNILSLSTSRNDQTESSQWCVQELRTWYNRSIKLLITVQPELLAGILIGGFAKNEARLTLAVFQVVAQ